MNQAYRRLREIDSRELFLPPRVEGEITNWESSFAYNSPGGISGLLLIPPREFPMKILRIALTIFL